MVVTVRARWDNPYPMVRAVALGGSDTELLVYADALEGSDPVRAQLIHLQCDLAKLAPWERRACEVRSEIEALVAEHGARLAGEMPEIPGVTWRATALDFAFGYVGTAHLASAAALAAAAAALAEQTPVTRVVLEDRGGALGDAPLDWMRALEVGAGAAPDPRLCATVRELVLVDTYGGDWLARPDDAPPLRGVTLTGSTDAGAAVAEVLVGADWARGLRTLEIPSDYEDDNSGYQDDPRLGPDGARSLAKLPGLQRLVVDRHRIGGVALGKLCGALPELRSLSARENGVRKLAPGTGALLVELDLSANALGLDGLRALVKAARAAALEQLVLDTCEIESLGVAELVRAPAWHTLRRLVLSRNPLGASAIRELAAAPVPKQLHALALADADLDDTAGQALAKVAWLGQLSELELSGNPLGAGAASLRAITGEAMRRLRLAACGLQRAEAAAVSRFWPMLVELDLSNNAITDAGLERFAAMKPAPALQRLALHDCGLTADGVELLARARTPRLRILDLAGNALGASVLQLLAAPSLRSLEELDLRRCGAATIDALVAATALPPRLATLDLRDNELDEAALLAVANAPGLAGIRRIRLDGHPFVFADASRARLEQRFGPSWHLDHD